MLEKLRKAAAGAAPYSTLVIYLLGAATISVGAALIYLPAGVIAGGALLVALVVPAGGES